MPIVSVVCEYDTGMDLREHFIAAAMDRSMPRPTQLTRNDADADSAGPASLTNRMEVAAFRSRKNGRGFPPGAGR